MLVLPKRGKMRQFILLSLIFFIGNTTVSCIPEGEFAIYLPQKKIPINKIAKLQIKNKIDKLKINRIKLQEYPFISVDDLIAYSLKDHIMELKPEAYEKLYNIDIHEVFIVCVGRKPIYWGVIWSAGLSAPFTGIVIRQPLRPGEHLIKIECGFPTDEYFKGIDLRGDKRIIDSLRKSGKLIE